MEAEEKTIAGGRYEMNTWVQTSRAFCSDAFLCWSDTFVVTFRRGSLDVDSLNDFAAVLCWTLDGTMRMSLPF